MVGRVKMDDGPERVTLYSPGEATRKKGETILMWTCATCGPSVLHAGDVGLLRPCREVIHVLDRDSTTMGLVGRETAIYMIGPESPLVDTVKRKAGNYPVR